MPTIEEIRTEWKGLKGAVATVINYVDGKIQHLGEIESCWQKGYDCGHEDGLKQGMSQSEYCYQRGLEIAWEAACRIIQMDEYKRADVFFSNAEFATIYEPFMLYSAEEAIQLLKAYDDAMHRVTHSNAQKFVEVFGFAPGYEILDDGREVYPSLNDEFWNAEYKEPKEDEE